VTIEVRPIDGSDYPQWRPLWDGYNAFYGRQGRTALAEEVTRKTWGRLLESDAIRGFVVRDGNAVVGLVHFLFHPSTNRLGDVCYLQDLFTALEHRRGGIGRMLIESVYAAARARGCTRVYWHTQETNATARSLYDRAGAFSGFVVYQQELRA
jgi:ribosomal protein S18 acetylase RimI-like enzyme